MANGDAIQELRRSGRSWRAIGREMGVAPETAKKAAQTCSKIPQQPFSGASSDLERASTA
jgi:hypothetical protein